MRVSRPGFGLVFVYHTCGMGYADSSFSLQCIFPTSMKRNLLALLASLSLALCAAPVLAGHADTVEARLASGRIVSADFHAGKRDRVAVLVLHGFLQTRAFPTVVSVREALVQAGYTVVAPTLSLGISRRNRSLPCEAIQLHTLNEGVEEVAFWVRWLQRRGYHRIVLVGHSFGSVHLLHYLGATPSAAVKRALLISLADVELRQSAQQRAQVAQGLRERVARRDPGLAEIELGPCRKYVGPPAALLSYMAVTRDSLLKTLARVPVPVTVVMGDKDDRMGAGWVDTLVARGVDVRMIAGASHFFDNQYEFDLQDTVLQVLADR